MQLQEQRKYLGDILAFVEENQGGNGNPGGQDAKPKSDSRYREGEINTNNVSMKDIILET